MAIPMNLLKPGGRGKVLELTADGPMRRRLLDLGVTPGASVQRLLASPIGDPVCFLIRGAQIALRCADAALIRVAV